MRKLLAGALPGLSGAAATTICFADCVINVEIRQSLLPDLLHANI